MSAVFENLIRSEDVSERRAGVGRGGWVHVDVAQVKMCGDQRLKRICPWAKPCLSITYVLRPQGFHQG